MKGRSGSLLAWLLFAIITVIVIAGLADALANRPADDNLFKLINDLLWGSLAIEFALVAALIVARQPRNVIGWLLLLPPSFFVVSFMSESYLQRFPTAPAAATAPLVLAVVFSGLSWLLLIFPLLFTALLFPDGRPPSPRWRWLPVAGLGMCAFLILYALFSPALTLEDNSDWVVANPVGLLPAEIEFPFVPWSVALALVAVFCLAAPFVRYRRAAGVQREQIKWLLYACALFALVYLPGALSLGEADTLGSDASEGLFVLVIMAIPAAIAVAILRYRLYDIDIIIRKTLLYGALTGLLAIVYFGSVVLLQAVVESLTGASSPVVIVISTLLIAALFAPLRRRLQTAIDRRFFRQKYNAQQVLAQFAQTARDEVELEKLTAELMRVTRETVQPASVSIWLKP